MTDKLKGQLGDLELEVMGLLWKAQEPLQVNQVVKLMGHSKAYTTIMTTMARLHEKGYLEQNRVGRAYVYSPRVSRASVVRRMWSRMADILADGDMVELIPHLLGRQGRLTKQERRFLESMAQKIDDTEP